MDSQYQCDFNLKKEKTENASCSKALRFFSE